jgi:hypothetical protein
MPVRCGEVIIKAAPACNEVSLYFHEWHARLTGDDHEVFSWSILDHKRTLELEHLVVQA